MTGRERGGEGESERVREGEMGRVRVGEREKFGSFGFECFHLTKRRSSTFFEDVC